MAGEIFKSKRNVILVLVCIALVAMLIVYNIFYSSKESNPDKNIVTVGQVAKAVSLIYHTGDECKAAQDYFEGSSQEWFVPYMNAMYSDTFFLEKDIKPTEAAASEGFTYSHLEKLFTNMGVADRELWSYVKNNKKSGSIVTKEWNEIYVKLVALLDVDKKISEKKMCIVGTVSNVPSLESWKAVTTAGQYMFTGLSVDYYIDREVTVLVKGSEILCVKEIISEDVTYYNSWIITAENGKAKAFIEGAVREFELKDKSLAYSSVAADIVIKNKRIDDLKVKSKTASGKVLSSGASGIELETGGTYQLSENVKVYKTYGKMEIMKISDVLVGYDIQRFILDDENKICAVIMDRDLYAKDIRVLLRSSGYGDMYHDKVIFTCDTPFELSYGSESRIVDGGTKIELDVNSEYLKDGRISARAQSVNGKITIETIERGYGTPSYRGSIEVAKKDGRLVIINELPIEEYLYAVVPSEMPYTYSTEALKSQAVCARSYAYKHLLNNSLREYGAHVDDSTAYQVYNNSQEKTTTNAAVDETYGEVMMYGEQVVTAWFFSTSCGSTTDATVWGGSGIEYIEGHILSDEEVNIDLSEEANFDTFIRSSFDSYDSSYPWYRWTLNMSLSEMTETVNKVIGDMYKAAPDKILTLCDDDTYKSVPVSTVGNVKRIALGDRGTGGVLNYIVVYGTEATVKVKCEGNIRKLFYPVSEQIVRADGSASSFYMLPSAYIIADPVIEDGTVKGYKFIGGGYGHGVGMSQNGANTMGNNGYTYTDILNEFFKKIDLKKIY